ncbi:MAG: DNA repair protein RecN [Anaerolineae bacterium]
MLRRLSIRNLAVIEALDLELAPGFTVLTGETGAGKSIIVDAVGLVLGGRASSEVIRTGCEETLVEAVFDAADLPDEVLAELRGDGLVEEGSCRITLTREVSRERRNASRLGGHTIRAQQMQVLGQYLVDIHGQGDQLSLLQVRNHVDLLDRFGDLGDLRTEFAARARELEALRRELEAIREDSRALAQREDLLRYQVNEIEAARLRLGEEQELLQERHVLANAEQLMEQSAEAYQLLATGRGRGSALDQLGLAVKTLQALARIDGSLDQVSSMLETAYYQVEDVAHRLRDYRERVEFDPSRLVAVEDRLMLLATLKRKYGESIEQILSYGERAARELHGLEHREEHAEELAKRETTLLQELSELGTRLSDARREAAKELAAAVLAELADLEMGRARFAAEITWSEDVDGIPVGDARYAWTRRGLDRVEFLISANPGEGLRPLAHTASGGETSRLMLALKNVLSAADPTATLIFDEVDAGIGGRAGAVVGAKLASLADRHQVLCVTHLPQIAACAQHHIRVDKALEEGRTVSTARTLSPEERVDELAVMLSGAVTEASRQSARELLERSGIKEELARENRSGSAA